MISILLEQQSSLLIRVLSFLVIYAPMALAFSHTRQFLNARLLIDGEIKEGELWVTQGKIVAPQRAADEVIDVQGKILAPGFIDLQINGAFGCDFSRNPQQIAEVAKQLLQFGVTAFFPTVVSLSPEQYRAILPNLQPSVFDGQRAANLGIHLEGPFFCSRVLGSA